MHGQGAQCILLSMVFLIFSISLIVYEWLQLFYIQHVYNGDYFSVKLIGHVAKKYFHHVILPVLKITDSWMFTPTTNYASATFEKCFPIYLYLTSRKCLFSLKNEQYYKRKSCPKCMNAKWMQREIITWKGYMMVEMKLGGQRLTRMYIFANKMESDFHTVT